MATANTKQLTNTKTTRTDWSQFARFTLTKLTENIYDTGITIVVLSLLLSYLLITTPVMAVEYGGYIITAYVLILLRRIVHDFDESWTVDELGERVVELENRIMQYQRAIEIEMSDDEIADRINGS